MGLGIFGTFLSIIGSAFIDTMQSKGAVALAEHTKDRLRLIQGNRGKSVANTDLVELVDDLVTACAVREGLMTWAEAKVEKRARDHAEGETVPA